MKPGKQLSEIHSKVTERLFEADKELAPLLPSVLAKSIGLFLEEPSWALSSECQKTLSLSQVFCVHLYLMIPNLIEKLAYLQVSEMLTVTENGAYYLGMDIQKKYSKISYLLDLKE